MADKSSFIEYVNFKGPKNMCSVSSVKKVSRKLSGNRTQYDKRYGNRSCNTYHQKNFTDIAQLLISNLHYGVTDYDIQQLFLEMGPLKKFGVQYNCQGQSLGTAEVIFEHRKDAIKAWQEYNGRTLDGKPLIIQLSTTEDNCACEMFSFKQSRFVNRYASSYDRRYKNTRFNIIQKPNHRQYGNRTWVKQFSTPNGSNSTSSSTQVFMSNLDVEVNDCDLDKLFSKLDVLGDKIIITGDDNINQKRFDVYLYSPVGEYIKLDLDEEDYNNIDTKDADIIKLGYEYDSLWRMTAT